MGTQIKIFSRTIWISKRVWGQAAAFVAFMIGLHYVYYSIQKNPTITPINARQELFYVKWIKQAFPSLSHIGIDDSEAMKIREEFKKKNE